MSRMDDSTPSSPPPASRWPDRPLCLRKGSSDAPLSLASLQPIPIDTALFTGSMILRLASNAACAEYFRGKKRLNSAVVTGRFKKRVRCAALYTGQEFARPIEAFNPILNTILLAAFRYLAPLLEIELGERPSMLSPLAQTVQALHVSDTPFALSPDVVVVESTAAMGLPPEHCSTAAQRKTFFSEAENLQAHCFDTEHFFTMDFYNDKIDLEAYSLLIAGLCIDLTPYLCGQPLRIMAGLLSTTDNENGEDVGAGNSEGTAEPRRAVAQVAWDFEVWHVNLLSD